MKEVVVDDIKKEIIAFANCDGGKLYIGIRDDGTAVGLDNPDGVSLLISNMVRDASIRLKSLFFRERIREFLGIAGNQYLYGSD